MNDTKLNTKNDEFDHSSHQEFYNYYAKLSQDPRMFIRLHGIVDLMLRVLGAREDREQLHVLDIGCNAGALTILWAQKGHVAYGLDVNGPLLELARERAHQEGLSPDFRLGTATELPWPAESMDICVLPELLEHVAEWAQCLDEACRVMRPGGVLYLSTSNKLCPKQYEFNLPLYSWYPPFLKRHYEKLSVTTRPDLTNYAKYPAVHWFTYFQLSKMLQKKGFVTQDRFDLMDRDGANWLHRLIPALMRVIPPLRWMGHVLTPYTVLVATKKK